MNVYIKSLKIKANVDVYIEFNINTTVIYGYTGTGKTLMFKLIEFALGQNSKVDIVEVEKKYEGIEYVELEFSNGIVFKRIISNDFSGFVKMNNETGFESKNNANYRLEVGNIFGHKNIKVIQAPTTIGTVTFSVPEFINTLFFPEARIVDDKFLIEVEGRGKEIKLTNYYKYLTTGIEIDNTSLNSAKSTVKAAGERDKVKKFLAIFKKKIVYPKKKELDEIESLSLKINEVKLRLLSMQHEVLSIDADIKQNKFTRDRLLSLIDLYEVQIEDMYAAKAIDMFMVDSEISCDKCGNKIKWERGCSIDDEIYDSEGKRKDVNITLDNLNKNLLNLQTNLYNSNNYIENNMQEYNKYVDRKTELDKIFNDFLVYKQSSEVLLTPELENSDENEIDLYDEINKSFEINIKSICKKMTARLTRWKLPEKTDVDFDFDNFDFTFDGTARRVLAKGYKGFCTTAMIIELVMQMKSIGVPCFDFILIDTIWQTADVKEVDIVSISENYLKDVSKLPLQVIIFENKVPNIKIESCEYIQLYK